jgi:sugar-specific transcriptional regulator TrmB
MIDNEVVEKLSDLAEKLRELSSHKDKCHKISEKVREKLKEFNEFNNWVLIINDDQEGGHQFYEKNKRNFEKRGIDEIIVHNLLKGGYIKEINPDLKSFFDSLYEKKIWGFAYKDDDEYFISLSDAATREDIIGYIRS